MSGNGPSDIAGIKGTVVPETGESYDQFDLAMALSAAGMSESTTLAQIAKALTYWQSVVANPTKDPQRASFAAQAVAWLQAWQAQCASPPINTLRQVQPV